METNRDIDKIEDYENTCDFCNELLDDGRHIYAVDLKWKHVVNLTFIDNGK